MAFNEANNSILFGWWEPDFNLDFKFQLQQTVLIFQTNFQKTYTSGE